LFTLFEYINEKRLALQVMPLSHYVTASTQSVLDNEQKLLAIKEADEEEDEETKEQVKVSITLFDEICRVLRGMMCNGPSKNHKVKRLVAYTLFPRLFNEVQTSMQPVKSAQILLLMNGASTIDWGSKEANEDHFMQLINLNSQLIKAKGVQIRIKQLPEFDKVLETFGQYFKCTTEQVKRDSLKVLQQYLTCLFEQIVNKQRTPEQQLEMLQTNFGFLKRVTTQILPLMSDYFDSVRGECCVAVEYLIWNFIPERNDFSNETRDLLQMIKSTLSIGWNDHFAGPLKEIAKTENEHVSYLFEDAQAF